jgi:hypothetical protein
VGRLVVVFATCLTECLDQVCCVCCVQLCFIHSRVSFAFFCGSVPALLRKDRTPAIGLVGSNHHETSHKQTGAVKLTVMDPLKLIAHVAAT